MKLLLLYPFRDRGGTGTDSRTWRATVSKTGKSERASAVVFMPMPVPRSGYLCIYLYIVINISIYMSNLSLSIYIYVLYIYIYTHISIYLYVCGTHWYHMTNIFNAHGTTFDAQASYKSCNRTVGLSGPHGSIGTLGVAAVRTCDMTWHDMTWHDMTWHDMAWHGMAWHDMTRHDTTRHDATWHDATWRDMT